MKMATRLNINTLSRDKSTLLGPTLFLSKAVNRRSFIEVSERLCGSEVPKTS